MNASMFLASTAASLDDNWNSVGKPHCMALANQAHSVNICYCNRVMQYVVDATLGSIPEQTSLDTMPLLWQMERSAR
jgi:hypothetical protein